MTDPRPMPSTVPSPRDGRTLRRARRLTVIGVIVSVSLAAVVAIISVVTGDLSQQGPVILTTLLVTGFGLTMLCHLAVAGRPVRVVSFVGIAASAVALIIGLTLTWAWSWSVYDLGVDLWRWFGVSVILAVSLAQANLLLLLAGRRHPAVRVALAVTLGAIAALALIGILPLVSGGAIPAPGTEDAYFRTAIVVAIIDALGTIVLPVVAVFLREPGEGAVQIAPVASPADAEADETVEQRIARLQASTGLGRDALLAAAFDAFENSRRMPEAN
jgi:hypothetical protein